MRLWRGVLFPGRKADDCTLTHVAHSTRWPLRRRKPPNRDNPGVSCRASLRTGWSCRAAGLWCWSYGSGPVVHNAVCVGMRKVLFFAYGTASGHCCGRETQDEMSNYPSLS
jgi:hypothetical protein